MVALFSTCVTAEEKYQKIIMLGKEQKRLSDTQKTKATQVVGCQSRMYLYSSYEGGLLYFQCEADALISAGLGILLTKVYSGETPHTILTCPPKYLETLAIAQTLTPGRANGLASLYIRIKQEALKYYSRGTHV
jgi:cysteine desulfuration protein SufE